MYRKHFLSHQEQNTPLFPIPSWSQWSWFHFPKTMPALGRYVKLDIQGNPNSFHNNNNNNTFFRVATFDAVYFS